MDPVVLGGLAAGSIRRLAPETASRIAAGEVIERPLSAVKEIVENALDAGATSIDIRVERSLDTRFAVADDGVGIAEEQLELALERHATSKIVAIEDLDRLSTLGFRGEALPSIAAVSRMRLTSRTRDADAAGMLAVEGGAVVERARAARAPGTTIEVAELFFNTPARRKFLHSPAGELRAAIRMLECYALAFPRTAFRLTVDTRTRFDWPAVTDSGDAAAAHRARTAALFGPRHAAQLASASGERDGVRVEALLGLPEHARTTREAQVVLLNRRWIQSPLVAQAVRRAYGDLLPPGRHPAFVLWLEVPAERLDVNVHPTKREVRFADDGLVFGLVAGTCARPLAGLHPPFTVVRGGVQDPEPKWADRVRERPTDQTSMTLVGGPETAPGATARTEGEPASATYAAAGAAGTSDPAATRATAGAAEPELWQLHRTYVLAPVRGGLVIIDQHAAHERILYEEALRRMQGHAGMAQQLLFPMLVDLSQSQFDLVLELGPWLAQLGWDLSPLGPPTVMVRGVPPEIRADEPGRVLQDVLDGVSESTQRDARRDVTEHLARTYACHTAVRAGDALSPTEMRALVDRLFATSKPHGDPHGRVTFVRLDLDELHRRFGRT
jgi:DNA mismatch repair protein MutL